MKLILALFFIVSLGSNSSIAQDLEAREFTRYFLTESAFQIEGGEVVYQNGMLFFNQLRVGVSDNFSITTGAAPFSFFTVSDNYVPLWITTKATHKVNDLVRLGGGTLLGSVFQDKSFNDNPIGLAYGIMTIGNKKANFTGGLVYGYVENRWMDGPSGLINGMFKIGPRMMVVSENILIFNPGDHTFFSMFGIRTWTGAFSIETAAFTVYSDENSSSLLPWLGITISF